MRVLFIPRCRGRVMVQMLSAQTGTRCILHAPAQRPPSDRVPLVCSGLSVAHSPRRDRRQRATRAVNQPRPPPDVRNHPEREPQARTPEREHPPC